LILGGALGNVGDRLLRSPDGVRQGAIPSGGFFHGAVIDWIQLPHWPIFNIADSCVTVGIVTLVFIVLKSEL
jgi:signal peptidase II